MAVERCRVQVTGTVQGVGFRPFVYRNAVELGLAGFVGNDSSGVFIEVQGPPEGIIELCRRLVDSPPPLALVAGVSTTTMTVGPSSERFVIVESADGGAPHVPVSVDVGPCDACLAEIDDPTDRRYGYPFTNCTNCGPRYTIVICVPYDRPATTMAGFTMCAACAREYLDPADRRFHAQPNACPACGPGLAFRDPSGAVLADGPEALDAAVSSLERGAVLAVKGVGGFHLAADARSSEAVGQLRRRKSRDEKPFAVMVADVPMARSLVELPAVAEVALTSTRRPIVLAPRHPSAGVADAVAPGLAELGIMLPYSPLHHLLMQRLQRPLVLTSGNLSDDPIAYTDADAVTRLGPMVDGVLTHDRPIHIRCDDSVVRVTEGRTQILRRSRGFAPEPIGLPFAAQRQVLAVGAQLKNTVSVAKDRVVVASHHIGDLEHLATYQSFVESVEHLCRLYGVDPQVVAHDLHPEYLSTKFAGDLDLPAVGIQHHHAHVASCLVDNGHAGTVLGVAYDGLGFGSDGTLWGGEFLLADFDRCERVGHLRAVQLPGGGAAIREPWRMAVAWVASAVGRDAALATGMGLDPRAGSLLSVIEAGSSPETTSIGRLFDAVAALVGCRSRVTYEGQAAIELEALARRGHVPRELDEVSIGWDDGCAVLDPSPLIAGVVRGVGNGTPPSQLAAGFHESVGRATVAAVVALARRHGVATVALTGGVFQNMLLTGIVEGGLRREGIDVLVHRTIPPNDGGISIGQAAIAAHSQR